MDKFYMIVVVIAVLVLILCLTGVGILMGYQNANLVFPPAANNCPDGWTSIGNICRAPEGVSVKGITPAQGYDSTKNSVDFSNAAWKNICDKKKWCNTYNVGWDGVSNYNKC